MIYISSACVKSSDLRTVLKTIADEGYSNIELSGGTKYDPKAFDILVDLKKEYQLNYLLHNYYPTPAEPFVINLASLKIRFNRFRKRVYLGFLSKIN